MHADHASGEGTPRERVAVRNGEPAPSGAGERSGAAASAGGGKGRRVAVVSVLIAVAALVVATGAEAYRTGQLIWAKKIGASTSQASGRAIAGAPGGTIAMAGWRLIQPAGQAQTQVPMVARYDVTGLKWTSTYAARSGYANAVACDRGGNVYVAATVGPLGQNDLLLLKYDSGGDLKWEQLYDGPAGLDDSAVAVAVDRDGNAVVVGRSKAASAKTGIVIIKYRPDGTEFWPAPARFDTDPNDVNAGWVRAGSLALDAAGDIYVAGDAASHESGAWIESALTLKFDGATGAKEWDQFYEARNGAQSYAAKVTVRGARVVIVGSTWGLKYGGNENGLVVLYDAASGVEKRWREWGAGNSQGEWFGGVVLDGSGYVYVTGDQRRAGTGSYDRVVTMKLTPSLSQVVWRTTYLPATRNAAGWHIARDGLGNIYVSGVQHDARAYDDFVTIKYGPGGGRKWARVWSGGGPDDDEPNGLVLGTTGGVFVGGQTTVKDGTERAVLLKYQR